MAAKRSASYLAIVKSRLNMAVLKDRGRKGGHSTSTGFGRHMKGIQLQAASDELQAEADSR
jgi:hypothetical protein